MAGNLCQVATNNATKVRINSAILNGAITALGDSGNKSCIGNGDFESGVLSPWIGSGNVSIDNVVKHGGNYSAKIGNTTPNSYIEQTFEAIKVENLEYLDFYALSDANPLDTMKTTFFFTDAEPIVLNSYPANYWGFFNFVALVKTDRPNKHLNKIRIENNDWSKTRTLWIDDVRITSQSAFKDKCTKRGFEWGIESGVYTSEYIETGTFDVGIFNKTITDLLDNTTYYFIAKAYSSAGWGYGEEKTFKTLDTGDIGEGPRSVLLRVKSILLGKDENNVYEWLGVKRINWRDVSPWVHIDIPSGRMLHQHLRSPHIEIEIEIYDVEALRTALYITEIDDDGHVAIDTSPLTLRKYPIQYFLIRVENQKKEIVEYIVERLRVNTIGVEDIELGVEAKWIVRCTADSIKRV